MQIILRYRRRCSVLLVFTNESLVEERGPGQLKPGCCCSASLPRRTTGTVRSTPHSVCSASPSVTFEWSINMLTVLEHYMDFPEAH